MFKKCHFNDRYASYLNRNVRPITCSRAADALVSFNCVNNVTSSAQIFVVWLCIKFELQSAFDDQSVISRIHKSGLNCLETLNQTKFNVSLRHILHYKHPKPILT